MIIFMVAILVAVVTLFANIFGNFECKLFNIIFISLVAGVVAAFANLFIGLGLHGSPYDVTVQKPLANIQLASETVGHYSSVFFVASGYINGKLEYLYYAKQPNGYYELETRGAHNTFIQQSSIVAPNVKCVTYKNHDPSSWATIFPDSYNSNKSKCYITVPPGTIKNEYNLQLPSKG